MMTRPFIILLAGLLLSSAAAVADRRKRDRDRDRDDEEEKTEEAPTRTAKRSIGGEDRRRAARAVDSDDEQPDEDRPRKKSKKEKPSRVADVDGDVDVDIDAPNEAQGVVQIDLDELVEVMVRHSPNLARAKLRRAAARGDAGAARSDQAWNLKADAKYSQFGIGGDTEVDLATVVKEEKFDGSLSLFRKTPVGGSIEARVSVNRTWKELAVSKEALNAINGIDTSMDKGFQADLQEYTNAHQIVGVVTLTQSLLRGFGSDVALAKEHKADFAASEATLNAQYEAEKQMLESIKLYWETAVSFDELETRNQALDMAQRQEKLTRDEIRAGAAANNALAPVLYEIASRKAAKLKAEIDLDKKSLELRRKVGLNLADRTLVVRPNQPLVIDNEMDFDVNDMLSQSRKSNRRLVMLAMRRRQADVDVKVANNAMLPQADLSLSAGLMGTGDTPDQAFRGASGAAGYQVMASLTFQWEISGAAKDAHRAALARRSEVDVNRIEAEREIETDVVAATAAVKAARQRVTLMEEAIRLAEENVKNERANFENQRSSNFEVMKRQSELVDSMLNRTRAVADYHIAVAQLQFSTGTLLNAYRVNVRPVAEK